MRRPSINLGRIDHSSEKSFTAQLIALILGVILFHNFYLKMQRREQYEF